MTNLIEQIRAQIEKRAKKKFVLQSNGQEYPTYLSKDFKAGADSVLPLLEIALEALEWQSAAAEILNPGKQSVANQALTKIRELSGVGDENL